MEKFQKDLLFKLKQLVDLSDDVATFIVAQSVLETGNFTSRIFKENNNLFGMKLPKRRPSSARGQQFGHAFYLRRVDSVIDYLLWLTYNGFTRNHLHDLALFRKELDESLYCPFLDYVSRIDKIYEQLLKK